MSDVDTLHEAARDQGCEDEWARVVRVIEVARAVPSIISAYIAHGRLTREQWDTYKRFREAVEALDAAD